METFSITFPLVIMLAILFFVIIIKTSMRNISKNWAFDTFSEALENGDKKARIEATHWYEDELALTSDNHVKERIIRRLLNALRGDPDWRVRDEALKAIAQHLSSRNTLLSWPPVSSWLPREQLLKAFIDALHDEHPHVRARAADTIGFLDDTRIIEPLIQALSDSDKTVQKMAKESLKDADFLVKTVVFASYTQDQELEWNHTLRNPDLSHLTFSLSYLKKIIFDGDTCEMRKVEKFVRYLNIYFDEIRLSEAITISFLGDPTRFTPQVYQICQKCRRVEVAIDTVIFGEIPMISGSLPLEIPYNTGSVISNPDVSSFSIPMSRLKQIMIGADSYDFYRLEQFLTYAVSFLGQKYLKKHVDVHLYGDPKLVHPNLYNNLQNLCRQIIHE